MTEKELILTAIAAREKAYTPYSHFKVGAALEAESGQVYGGCNIENAAYTPSNCAERTAFFKAVSQGERAFKRIAIVAGPEGGDLLHTTPCGVCRQVMQEFCGKDFLIYVIGPDGAYDTYTLAQLLPGGFSL